VAAYACTWRSEIARDLIEIIIERIAHDFVLRKPNFQGCDSEPFEFAIRHRNEEFLWFLWIVVMRVVRVMQCHCVPEQKRIDLLSFDSLRFCGLHGFPSVRLRSL